MIIRLNYAQNVLNLVERAGLGIQGFSKLVEGGGEDQKWKKKFKKALKETVKRRLALYNLALTPPSVKKKNPWFAPS